MPLASKSGARIYGIIAANLGFWICVYSLSLFVGSALLIPGNPVLRSIDYQEPVGEKNLKLLIDSRKTSLEWHEKASTWSDLGLTQMLLSEKLKGTAQTAELEKAKTALRNGLAMAPADPFAWISLAQVLLDLEGPSTAAGQVVSLGLTTGPDEHLLGFEKLKAGVLLWDYLSQGDRLKLRRLALHEWEYDPLGTTAIFKQANRTGLLFGTLDTKPDSP